MSRLRHRAAAVAAILGWVAGASAGAASERTFRSPDGALAAVVIPAGPGKESRVEIRDRGGELMVSADHSSPDGEHGLVVEHVAWSPDSQFLVYSARSSGGHQPWTSPTHVYDRKRGKISNLECFLPPTSSTPRFRLRAPDELTITVWSPFSQGLAGSIELPVTIRLRDLRRPPAEPAWPECSG